MMNKTKYTLLKTQLYTAENKGTPYMYITFLKINTNLK